MMTEALAAAGRHSVDDALLSIRVEVVYYTIGVGWHLIRLELVRTYIGLAIAAYNYLPENIHGPRRFGHFIYRSKSLHE